MLQLASSFVKQSPSVNRKIALFTASFITPRVPTMHTKLRPADEDKREQYRNIGILSLGMDVATEASPSILHKTPQQFSPQ